MEGGHISELYKTILKSTRDIKESIMLELVDTIPFSGNLPDETIKELDVLSSMEGLAISMLRDRGEEIKEVKGKKDYVCVKIGDSAYVTHISKLLEASGSTKQAVNEGNAVPLPEKTEAEEREYEDIQNPEEEKDNSECGMQNSELKENYEETEPGIFSEMKRDKQIFHQEDADLETDTASSAEQDEMDEMDEADEAAEAVSEEPLKATIIGGDYVAEPVIAPMARADMFIEEKRKAASEFVFDSYRVSVCHKFSKVEDMQIMIAPLKIQKYACPTVPIIVSIYYNGRLYTASSFDKNEDGKNIVTIDVNEYYFLCRGFFNNNGGFQSTISTTGISANQGDMINIVSHKHCAPIGTSVRNGHLKFRYEGEDGPGIIEIFPLSLEEKDFVMMTRCGEFVEYIPISNKSHGLNRALIYDRGVKSEVICMWDGEFLEAEVAPI